jgi:hypothetical protein
LKVLARAVGFGLERSGIIHGVRYAVFVGIGHDITPVRPEKVPRLLGRQCPKREKDGPPLCVEAFSWGSHGKHQSINIRYLSLPTRLFHDRARKTLTRH